jgi:hypothetical protein
MLKIIPTIRKALTAGGFTTVGVLGTSMADGVLTGKETIAGIGAGLVAGAATYLVPNATARPRKRREVPSVHDVDPDSEI